MDLEPGVYERLITRAVHQAIERAKARGHEVVTEKASLDRLEDALAYHVFCEVSATLRDLPSDDRDARLHAVEALLRTLSTADADDLVEDALPVAPGATLHWIGPPPGTNLAQPGPPARPAHGLTHPALIFNGHQDVSMIQELRAELATADRVDAVVAFLRWSGFRLLLTDLRAFFDRGGVLRLLVSTYTGATQARAVEGAVRAGARVRVVYHERGTRLHAKAWLFVRRGELDTAYIGSSNVSGPALTDGAEWNVRVTRARTPEVIERFTAAFEQLWEAAEADFHPENDADRLRASLGPSTEHPVPFLAIDARPFPHQLEVLDALTAEREGGHHRSLIVAATGTGKTWIAAFDYARQVRDGRRPSLLFVAHRKEILTQSLGVFRSVLGDPSFGELLVDGERPARGEHVFASIQSLRAAPDLDPEAYRIVIIDEFHHAAAKSYDRLLKTLRPELLLGLTATPERADGQPILPWFDHRIAAEIRLWHALDRDLLVPFHYFGIDDPTSAERAWRRGRLDPGELDRLYTGDHARAKKVVAAVGRYVEDPAKMSALGFCVGVGHARIMAQVFTQAGLPAVALHAGTPSAERRRALQQLQSGQIRAIFTVDLFNEGVDIPAADTVLFLRPTQSGTVFLQQLGRGLRKHEGKDVLTVLDLVGHVHEDFRYEARFQALLGATRRQVEQQVERGFPRLPSGCAIVLEPTARELVLRSVKSAIGSGWPRMTRALRALGSDATLAQFLDETRLDLPDLYRKSGASGWTMLRRAAGFEARPAADDEPHRARALGRMLHLDDRARLRTWRDWMSGDAPPKVASLDPRDHRLALMLATHLGPRRFAIDALQSLFDGWWGVHAPLRDELCALLDLLDDRLRHTSDDLGGPAPLRLHATYSRDEVIAGWGLRAGDHLREVREGVAFDAEQRVEVLFVTLDKSDDSFRPAIRYADYPISSTLFRWESQNRTTPTSPTGQRYQHHREQGVQIHLFVRAGKKDERGLTVPYTLLGPVTYVRHEGERPMRIDWRLHRPMPAWLLTAGAAAM